MSAGAFRSQVLSLKGLGNLLVFLSRHCRAGLSHGAALQLEFGVSDRVGEAALRQSLSGGWKLGFCLLCG